MKKFFAIALIFSALMVLAACNRQPAPEEPLERTVPVEYEDDLYLYADAGSITPTGLRLGMANGRDVNIGYGPELHIEAYMDGEWEQVPFIDDVAWQQPLFLLPPNTFVYDDISWGHLHGELPPGRYRVAREILVDLQARGFEYFYAEFILTDDWQTVHAQWQRRQDHLAAEAFARFEGLDLVIYESSPRGINFSLSNNNPTYAYHINSAFVGWEWEDPPGSGFGSGGVAYSIFIAGIIGGNLSWPFDNNKRLEPGESISLGVDWYPTIGELHLEMAEGSPHPNIFQLAFDVTLDVDEDYIAENLNHRILGVPGATHRIKATFDILS